MSDGQALDEASIERRDEVLRQLHRHQAMLSAVLFTLTEDWELVDEALQETAVYICGHWQEFQVGTNFGGWAIAIARFRLREVQRARRKHSRPLPKVVIAETAEDSEWAQYGDVSPRRKKALAECVESLPQHLKDIVQLRYISNKPCEQIAAALQRNVAAIYKMLSRTRTQLKTCVEHRLAGDTE
jgi:RNA polymerase sigma-70 factor, ECF subfamily